jgi:hypothetical protein
MNVESNSTLQRTQSGKPTSYKRAHRASRKPVLITEQGVNDAAVQTFEEAPQTEVAVVVDEGPSTSEGSARKRGPRFFASVEKGEKGEERSQADPIAARLARALRGKGASSTRTEAVVEKQAAPTSAKARATVPARPASSFKMRYIWGMVAYLLIADVAGVYITNFMQAQHLDARVFTWGPIVGNRSTLVFLALLVIILVLFARFDLIPRSLGGALSGNSKTPTSRNGTSSSKSGEATFETRSAQPTMKQGVQGADDSLYQEYRANQRYYQRRDRKR